jgi:hypothetical protein
MPKYLYILTERNEGNGEIVADSKEDARMKILKSINEAGGLVLDRKSYSVEMVTICPVCEQSQDEEDAMQYTMCWSCRNEFREEEEWQ